MLRGWYDMQDELCVVVVLTGLRVLLCVGVERPKLGRKCYGFLGLERYSGLRSDIGGLLGCGGWLVVCGWVGWAGGFVWSLWWVGLWFD